MIPVAHVGSGFGGAMLHGGLWSSHERPLFSIAEQQQFSEPPLWSWQLSPPHAPHSAVQQVPPLESRMPVEHVGSLAAAQAKAREEELVTRLQQATREITLSQQQRAQVEEAAAARDAEARELSATLLDTRKTIPGLRVLEKYATRMGGATNHRMGLWDAAMIKDNHVAVAGTVEEAVRRAVAAGVARIIVEVDRVDQIEPALSAGATHLLLDNMAAPVLRGAVTLVGGRVPTEASGGVTLETIRAKAETGVTYISVGRLTQSAPAADIGLDFAYA